MIKQIQSEEIIVKENWSLEVFNYSKLQQESTDMNWQNTKQIDFGWSLGQCTCEWDTMCCRELSLSQQCHAEHYVKTNNALVPEDSLKKKEITLLFLRHIQMTENKQVKSTRC